MSSRTASDTQENSVGWGVSWGSSKKNAGTSVLHNICKQRQKHILLLLSGLISPLSSVPMSVFPNTEPELQLYRNWPGPRLFLLSPYPFLEAYRIIQERRPERWELVLPLILPKESWRNVGKFQLPGFLYSS